MAKAVGISLGSVQRIWQAHKLQPRSLHVTISSSEDMSVSAFRYQ
jgi:hypothetical protein